MDAGSSARWDRTTAALIVTLTFLIRAIRPDQPIVENYVGRQVPTAMVARNLERGSGFLHPQLDTAPFPNYFVVEPPLYQSGVVVLRAFTGLSLEPSGRLLSAMATAAAAWAIMSLMRRRASRRPALLAGLAFAVFPMTIRYGRAFQPDAAMLGAVAAGLACWDRFEETDTTASRRGWFVSGWILLAIGLALKIIAAPLLIVPVLARPRERRVSIALASGSTLIPALLWYAWALHLGSSGTGSRAASDNAGIWFGLLIPSLRHLDSWKLGAWFLCVRAFTPIGTLLAVAGLIVGGREMAYWRAWAIVALLTLALLASKLHHEYYLLMLAPAVAAGIGRAFDRMLDMRHGRCPAIVALAVFLVLAFAQSRSTWRTPPEWSDLRSAARAIAISTPADAWIVAPEALLFAADRRGCRLEWTESAARRAAGEWPDAEAAAINSPIELIEDDHRRGARFFADLGSRAADPRRLALHDAVRQRYKVMKDRPEVFLADLGSVSPQG